LLGYGYGDRNYVGETNKWDSKEIREKGGSKQKYEMDKWTEQRRKGTVSTA
jgi:hypothetical protein